MQDTRDIGLSSTSKNRRKRRNLVSMQFNMINWMVEAISLFLVIFNESEFFDILYLLVTSCGTPLVYYLGIEKEGQGVFPVEHEDIRKIRGCSPPFIESKPNIYLDLISQI